MPIQPPVPPQDLDAEQSVLGACLLDPDALPKASAIITARDFYSERHSVIFEAMVAIAQGGAHPDYVTLSDRLEAAKRMEFVGGTLYLSGLVTVTPTAQMVEHYARIVADKSARRKAIALAGDIAKAAYSAEDFEGRRGEWLSALVDGARVTGGAEHISAHLVTLVSEVEERAKNPTDVWGLRTGINGIDTGNGGLQRSQVFVIAGDPGVGKTRLACQIGTHIAQTGVPGAIYEMDTRAVTVMRRAVSAQSGVRTRDMQTGYMEGKMQAFYEGVGKLSSLPLYFSDATHWTTTSLWANVAKLKAQHDIQWVVLDFFAQLRDVVGRGDDNNTREAHMANELKRMARELGIALLLVHTKNKQGMRDTKPNLAATAGSKDILYAFEDILHLTEFKAYKPEDDRIAEADRDAMLTATYVKMRDSEWSSGYFHLVQIPGSVLLGNYAKGAGGY